MKCRKALPLMAQGTDSAAETMLRLILIRYGLPIPRVNYRLILHDGSLVFLDLAYPEAKIDIEYDGRHHRYQWARDAQRTMKIRAEGWEYLRLPMRCSPTMSKCLWWSRSLPGASRNEPAGITCCRSH